MMKIVKIVVFLGNLENSGGDRGGDGVLNSNQQGTGQGKTAGDLGERVPWVPFGIPSHKTLSGGFLVSLIWMGVGMESTYFRKLSLTSPNFILEQQIVSHMKADIFS